LRAVATGIVQQNNAAIVALLFYALQDDVDARLRPILRIDVLQHNEVTEILCNLQWSQLTGFRRTRVRGIGWPEKRGRASGNRFEQELRRIKLQPDVLGPAKREIRVVIGMIANLVAFRHDPPNESGVFFRVGPDKKKS